MKCAAAAITVAFVTALAAQAQASARDEASISQTAGHVPTTVKRIRLETADAKAFVLNGHRILVPADENAEAMIATLKQRFPDLKPDTGASQGNPSVD